MKMYASSNNSNNNLPLPEELSEALEQEPGRLGQELERVWDLTGMALAQNATSSPQEVDEMWARIQPTLVSKEADTVASFRKKQLQPDRPPQRKIHGHIRVKAQWLVPALLILALVAFYWFSPVTVTADRGELATAILPDGSKVSLNSGSSISYRRGFDGIPFVETSVRSVKLNGEGFFDVTHSDAVFSVETFNAKIEVLGTEFNIRSWPEEPDQESTVSLVSGKVAVSRADNTGTDYILEEPGQTVIIRESDTPSDLPEMVELSTVLSWLDRGISIKSKTLVTVFSELERRYDIQITVEDAQILNDSLTLLMAKPLSIETILSDICIEKNLRFRKTSRGYVIYRPDL